MRKLVRSNAKAPGSRKKAGMCHAARLSFAMDARPRSSSACIEALVNGPMFTLTSEPTIERGGLLPILSW